MPAVTNVSGGPFAAGSTPVYTARIVDGGGVGIAASRFSALTLTIVDTLSGAVVNGVSQINILNTGRGTIDASGNLTISLLAGDMAMDEAPGAARIQRSLVIDWTFTTGLVVGTGRHQANFELVALAGP